ncbi:DoxX family protein [Georgenia sp. AZ-5]|uniref:DoxX family protein n=1 Tax=Georgenia sp. AZ-5 TaxID=3367526 RepID=UPI003755045B
MSHPVKSHPVRSRPVELRRVTARPVKSHPVEDAGLLALRAGVGGILIAHGCQKLFGWFGGHGLRGTATAFEGMGFKPGLPSAVAAGAGEAGGGALLALGLGTPLAAAAASGTMIAAAGVHFPAGFFAQAGGYEYVALLSLSSATLALTGPGAWSVDRLLGYRLNQPWISVAGIVASAVAATAVLKVRERTLAARAGAPAQEGPHAAATQEPSQGAPVAEGPHAAAQEPGQGAPAGQRPSETGTPGGLGGVEGGGTE